MKKTKKKMALFMAAVLAVGLCTSCSGNKQTGKTQLAVGSWPATEGSALDSQNKKKAEFEADNPDIEIVPDTWQFDLKTFYPKAEAGMLPNIFVGPYTEIGKLVDGEYVADITEYLKKYGYYDEMNKSIRDLVSVDGKVYALPYQAYALGIPCNMEMFKQAGLLEADGTPMQPKTWEELAEFAVKIKEATGKPGFSMATTQNCGGWLFTNIAWSYGVDFMEQDADGKWKATFNTPEMVEALEYVKDLRWKYDVLPENVLVSQDEMFKLLAIDGAGMTLSAPAAGSWAKYGMKSENLGMLAIPAGPKKRVTLVGGAYYAITAESDEKQIDAAFKWMTFSGTPFEVNDKVKENMQRTIQTQLDSGHAVGTKAMSIWSGENARVAYEHQLIDEKTNMLPNAAKYYNESLVSGEVELQAEEPVCAQDLYGLLDNCIQQVLNDENADCKAIVEKANADFQTNYLNNVQY